jgi:hypothetical protein
MREGTPDDVRTRPAMPALGALLSPLLLAALLAAPPALAQDEPPQAEPPADAPAEAPAEAPAAEAAPAPAPAPPTCDGPEHAQFDFWVGEWDVHEWGKEGEKKPAHNSITKIHNGCALREDYHSPSGYEGSSVNFYDRFDGHWHQTWIDGSGTPLYLVGGLEDGKMVMADSPDDGRPWSRITWTPQPDGSVRQTWEMSRDEGGTWDVAFDGRYVRQGG